MSWKLSPLSLIRTIPSGTTIVPVSRKRTFAIMEFLGFRDSNRFMRKMKRFGFEDVTPLFAGGASVTTFFCRQTALGESSANEDALAAKYPDFRNAMESSAAVQNADWFMLSGHHGVVRYQDGEDVFGGDANALFNDATDVGFFNEPYHNGAWSFASKAAPTNGALPNSIFMRSTEDRALGPAETNNPFPNPRPNCRGVLCIACNTFSYRRTRMWLRETFPNAIIFGFWATTPGGRQAIAPFLGAGEQKLNAGTLAKRRGILSKSDFWKDPAGFLGGDSAKAKKLTDKLNREYISVTREVAELKSGGRRRSGRSSIGMMMGDNSYRWENGRVIEEKYDARF